MYCVQVLHSEGCIILGRLGFCHFLIEIFKRINYSLALGFKFMFSKFRGLFTLALKSSREDLPIKLFLLSRPLYRPRLKLNALVTRNNLFHELKVGLMLD